MRPASAKGRKRKKEENKAPIIIDEKTGILLPEVDIDEDRVFTDYYAFNAFDVVKDVEIELDKGDYATDLYGYLLDKGYSVFFDYDLHGEPIKVYIDGYDPFFYVHDSQNFLYKGRFNDTSSISRLATETQNIKSLLVYDRLMYMKDIMNKCPLYVKYLAETLQTVDYETIISSRYLVIDVLIKEPEKLSTRDDRFKINKRVTTVDGYTPPYAFYAPEYPDGPVAGDIDYRRTLYWNPNVITDSIGQASVEFYNSSITEHFNISAAGITSSGLPYILDQDW